MNLFQIVALPLLTLLLIAELLTWLRRGGLHSMRLARLAIWLTALVLISKPTITSYVAHLLGIGRGADLVMYVFILIAPLAWFQLQKGQLSLERRIVSLSRAEAIRTAAYCDHLDDRR